MSTFISYSRADSAFAVKLAKDLKSAGYDVWLDQLDIPTGARWDDEIEIALEACTTFMIVLSTDSIHSQNVKDEVGYAIDAGKEILPVRMEACDIPLRLRRFQYVDFSDRPYEKSLKEIKGLLSMGGETLPSNEAARKQVKAAEEVPTLRRIPVPREHRAAGKGGMGAAVTKSPRISRGLVVGIAVAAVLAVGGIIISAMGLSQRAADTPPTGAPAVEDPSPEQPSAGPTADSVPLSTATPAGQPETFVAKFIESSELNAWEHFVLGLGQRNQVSVSTSANGLLVNLDDGDLRAYYIYRPVVYGDVVIRMQAENLGQNKYFVSLVCRRVGDKWYEFTVTGGGLWQLYDYDAGYQPRSNGGSPFIQEGKSVNEFEMRCIGNELSLYINGEPVGSYNVNRNPYTQGQVGFSISTEDVYPIDLRLIELEVSRPPG